VFVYAYISYAAGCNIMTCAILKATKLTLVAQRSFFPSSFGAN